MATLPIKLRGAQFSDGNIRSGSAFESQISRRRHVIRGVSHNFETESRPDLSGSYWLRSRAQGSSISASQAARETENALARDDPPNPAPATATPWMALFFVGCCLGPLLQRPVDRRRD
eukprot:4276130-Pyramimonas_sp.AAC.1